MWTGYVVENFTERQKEVLKYLDVLVDGPFQQENRNLSLAMRGSSNQRVFSSCEIFYDKYIYICIFLGNIDPL